MHFWSSLHFMDCPVPSKTELAIYIIFATVEIHYPSSNCAHIHCLVTLNIQQTLMNVNGCNFFFYIKEWTSASYTLSCWCCFVRLLSNKAKKCGLFVGRFNLHCHDNILKKKELLSEHLPHICIQRSFFIKMQEKGI